MKYFTIIFLCLFSFASVTVFAQQEHFIYLQTDNKQPFYIKLNNKIISSSSSGYLILSKLTAGSYKLIIGFPKSEWPEQNINVSVNKDAGFLIKNFGEKGWGFFNIQSNEVLMTGNIIKENNPSQVKSTDPFSTMLSNVVNDSSILQRDVVKDESETKLKEIKKVEPKEPGTNPLTDSIVSKNNTEDLAENKQPQKKDERKEIDTNRMSDNNVTTATTFFSVVKRTLRKKSKEGTELVYIDEFDNRKDTIRIFIPVEKETYPDTGQSKNVVIKTDASVGQDILRNDTVAEQKVVANTNDEKLKDQKTVKLEVKEEKPQTKEYKFIEDKKDKGVTKSAMINSDCKAFASDDDFLKLRKKMATETNDEDMIKVAKKAFKSKCYSTELIKNLSTLFLKDEGKYMFFDAAYPFISDSDLFPSLQNQLTDSYYINRFNAMVHK